MKNIISERLAVLGLMTILSLMVLFHIAVLTGIIPADIVWGGRLEDTAQMQVFELISLLVTIMLLLTVAIRGGYLKANVNPAIIRGVLWFMAFYFFLNTVGNLFAASTFEKSMAAISLLLALLSLRLAISKHS